MALDLIHKFHSGYVTPFMDAVTNYMAVGNGIYDGVLNGMRASISGGNIVIKSGYASVLGYVVCNSEDSTITTLSNAGSYTVGIQLTVVDETANGTKYAQAQTEYEAAMQAASVKRQNSTSSTKDTDYLVDINKAITNYSKAVSSLKNDSVEFTVRRGASTEPGTTILANGTGTDFIPLWSVSGTTITAINIITAGIPNNVSNVLSTGFFGSKKFTEIFNDFSGTDRPGARYADSSRYSDLADHIGANDEAHRMDSSFRMGNGGYLTFQICLFRDKSIDISKEGGGNIELETLPNSSGQKITINRLTFFGKNGVMLRQVRLKDNKSTFYLDGPNTSEDGHIVISADLNGKSDNIVWAVANLTQDIYTGGMSDSHSPQKVTLSDEYSVLTCYAEGAYAEL